MPWGLPQRFSPLTGEVAVAPMEAFGFDDFSAVPAPGPDDRGRWFGCDCDWQVDVDEGDACDAETIRGFCYVLDMIKAPA